MKKTLVAFTVLILFFTCAANAQNCPNPLPQRDSAKVKRFAFEWANPMLARLIEISYINAQGPDLVNIDLDTRRAAFEAEYKALVQSFDNLSSNPDLTSGLSPRAKRFLATVINSNFLNFAGTTVTGVTDEQARIHSLMANLKTKIAIGKLWLCM